MRAQHTLGQPETKPNVIQQDQNNREPAQKINSGIARKRTGLGRIGL